MNVLLDTLGVLGHKVHLVWRETLTCALNLAYREDWIKVFSPVETGNLTRVKDVVDVLKHLLVDDLRVDEDKGRRLAFNTSLH